jgi:multiple sugar transport system substrate-binding protein
MQTQVAAGDAPDIMTDSVYYYVPMAAKGVTRPVDDLIQRDKVDLTQFFAPAVAGSRWQAGRMATGAGKMYVMPASFGTSTTYYYNKSLFQEYGISPPDDTWTWDTWRDTAAKLTKTSNGQTSQWGTGTPVDGNNWMNAWIWQSGGDMFNSDFTACTLRSDGKAYDAFSYLVDLVVKYKVAPPPSDMTKAFEQSQLAMSSGGG